MNPKTPSTTHATCPFCIKFKGPTSVEGREWYDTELISFGDFAVVAALGALVEGHLMIVTRAHYQSMAYLSEEDLVQLHVLKREVRNTLSGIYQEVITFEHGPVTPSHSGGSCIDHAHLQMLPFSNDFHNDLFKILSRDLAFTPIHDVSELTRLRHCASPYLFYENPGGEMSVSQPACVPSQYMRRVICQVLGMPDQWDYALFPNFGLITSTIDKFRT